MKFFAIFTFPVLLLPAALAAVAAPPGAEAPNGQLDNVCYTDLHQFSPLFPFLDSIYKSLNI